MPPRRIGEPVDDAPAGGNEPRAENRCAEILVGDREADDCGKQPDDSDDQRDRATLGELVVRRTSLVHKRLDLSPEHSFSAGEILEPLER